MPKLSKSDKLMMSSLGARMRYIRKQRNLSMVNAANELGVAWQQIQKYETGQNIPSIVAIQLLARLYNVKPCEICGCNND